MHKPKAIFCWSGGKDSAYALYKVLSAELFEVKYLLTTVNETFRRISMHGVREELLDVQAEAIGIPLMKVYVNEGTNAEYERQMEAAFLKVKSEGVHKVIFGDIFLEDLRVYRENNLAKVGMQGIFPIWKTDTKWMLADFIRQGFKTITCCVNDNYLSKDWTGRNIDQDFIDSLPPHADACGENGEYHTFCYDGPLFNKPVFFSIGKQVYKPLEIITDGNSNATSGISGFWYCDLLPMK